MVMYYFLVYLELDTYSYRIRPNFRSAQFSRIAIFKHFAETIFADRQLDTFFYCGHTPRSDVHTCKSIGAIIRVGLTTHLTSTFADVMEVEGILIDNGP